MPTLVVPTAMAVGWELVVDDATYVVVKVDETPNAEVVVLQAPDGSTRQEPVVREDTADNAKELEGSPLPDTDSTTPGVTVEVTE